MTTIRQVSDDLETLLKTIVIQDGSSATWNADGWVGEGINAPVLKVARGPFDPRMVFGQTKASHQFTVTAYVPRSMGIAGEYILGSLCELSGTGSLIGKVQDGTAWSVTVDYASVTEVGQVVPVEVGGAEYLALPFTVEVVW